MSYVQDCDYAYHQLTSSHTCRRSRKSESLYVRSATPLVVQRNLSTGGKRAPYLYVDSCNIYFVVMCRFLVPVLLVLLPNSASFSIPPSSVGSRSFEERKSSIPTTSLSQHENVLPTAEGVDALVSSKRRMLLLSPSLIASGIWFAETSPAHAGSFAPGGTLVDYEVGVTVGNSQASKSRKADNSNVVFVQDYYYKFGTAAQWIEAGNTDFPKKMPFAPAQQRYEAMKKYRERVQRGIDLIVGLGNAISAETFSSIPDSTAPEYSIRPFGLLANSMFASENTGTTNELLLARWYINEISLDIDDIKNAPTKDEAMKSLQAAKAALNSYLGLLNRVITSKVGDYFDLV